MCRALSIVGLILCIFVQYARAQSHEDLKSLGDFFQIYLIKPELRNSQEKVSIKQAAQAYAVQISYWRSLKGRESEEEICNAYRWLLFGRGKYGKGAKEAFEAYPKLKRIDLEFFDVDSSTVVGQKPGEILPTRRYIPYLTLSVSRANLLQSRGSLAKIKKKMYKGQCAKIGSRYVDKATFDKNYIRQAN